MSDMKNENKNIPFKTDDKSLLLVSLKLKRIDSTYSGSNFVKKAC